MRRLVKKTILIYGAALASLAFILQWLDYQHTVRLFATELYVLLVAVGFTALGLWVGARLTSKRRPDEFRINEAALAALQVSDREFEVLQLLAEGLSNKEIAQRLFVSVNTVKTHINRLYDKLGVSRRTQAVRKGRSLQLIR